MSYLYMIVTDKDTEKSVCQCLLSLVKRKPAFTELDEPFFCALKPACCRKAIIGKLAVKQKISHCEAASIPVVGGSFRRINFGNH